MPKENISSRITDQLVPKAGVKNQLEFNETVRYLGKDFNRHSVKTWKTFGKKIKNTREKIRNAPQQRIYLLTALVQTKLYHQGTFANLCIKDVRKMDMLIRYIVKNRTTLPKDLATAIIHAYVRD